jgi:hypothetical protein
VKASPVLARLVNAPASGLMEAALAVLVMEKYRVVDLAVAPVLVEGTAQQAAHHR